MPSHPIPCRRLERQQDARGVEPHRRLVERPLRVEELRELADDPARHHREEAALVGEGGDDLREEAGGRRLHLGDERRRAHDVRLLALGRRLRLRDHAHRVRRARHLAHGEVEGRHLVGEDVGAERVVGEVGVEQVLRLGVELLRVRRLLAQPTVVVHDQLERPEDLLEGSAADVEQLDRARRLHRRRPRRVEQQCALAKVAVLADPHHLARLLPRDDDLAVADDVEGVGDLTLLDHRLAVGVARLRERLCCSSEYL